MIRFFRDISRILNAPCREHAAVMSRAMETPLTRGERVGLWLHLRICLGCRRLHAQMLRLSTLHRRLREAAGSSIDATIPADVRDRLRAAVESRDRQV